MDQVIEGNAFINNTFQTCCIRITDGYITKIQKTLKSGKRETFPNKLILPAALDMHVHFRDPGDEQKEDFFSGSVAAAYGGNSCICDMPNTKPFTDTKELLNEKITIAKKKSLVDFGIYSGISNKNVNCLDALSRYCCGYKLFLSPTTATEDTPFNNLEKIFYAVQKTNKLLMVHAEDHNCILRNKQKVQSLIQHEAARPAECEYRAIQKLLKVYAQTPVKLHICHLSSAKALLALNRRPQSITIGATPHHLLLDIENICHDKVWFKVNPPIRYKADREALWEAFIQGNIDIAESDHAPHTITEKTTDFSTAPTGMPGVETAYPLLLAAAKRGVIPLKSVIHRMSIRPAELLQIPKGKIKVGYHADLCVIDYHYIQKIYSKALHYKCGWSAFEGRQAIFPSDLFIRGNRIIKDYSLEGNKGIGKNIISSVG